MTLDDYNVENDITNDDQSSTDIIDKDDSLTVDNLIEKLEVNTEVIVVKPNLPIRIGRMAKSYSNLQDTHVIMVNWIKDSFTEKKSLASIFRFIILVYQLQNV